MSDTVSVAVIGFGPGGMFFCHAVESLIRTHGDRCRKISVTCFERSSHPGGVWRTPDENGRSSTESTNMYSALWTNGPSHSAEFFDYTFDDHFKNPVSVYMPRQAYLDYMLARVKRHCPDFVEKYAKLCHEVIHVRYDDDRNKFAVETKNLTTGDLSLDHFDKCIWACGENGKQKIPKSISDIFDNNGFKGHLMHSSTTHDLIDRIVAKRILLIGGGYSAEDLALHTIKLGASKVYISTRSSSPKVSWTGAWPMDKVEVLMNHVPVNVADDGTCIQFRKVYWTWPDNYISYGDICYELRDIDTVILCTGYAVNFDMLHEKLRQGFPRWGIEHDLKVPHSWEMKPNHLSHLTGDVKPSNVRYNNGCVHPNFYRGVLISNPSMLFLSTYDAYMPLMAIEAYSWYFASYLLGLIDLPSQEEMRRENFQQALFEMQIPYFRYCMDEEYSKKLDYLPDFWPNNEDPESGELWYKCTEQLSQYKAKMLARTLREANHPFDIGDYDELNDNGLAILKFDLLSYYHRASLDPKNDKENRWRTFRDYENGSSFYSLHTGTRAVRLPQRWLELDRPCAKHRPGSSGLGLKTSLENI